MLPSSSKWSSHFVLIFRRRGERKWRRAGRSRGFQAVYSLIRGNYERELGRGFAQNKTSSGMGLKLLGHPSPEQQTKVCSWAAAHQRSLPRFPVHTSHCYFIYCSWPTFYSLFHVLKFKCGKHYQYPPWIFCCCCWRVGVGFLPHPTPNFLFTVECIKWSKAHFRWTKFTNHFLCSYNSYWFAHSKICQPGLLHTYGPCRLDSSGSGCTEWVSSTRQKAEAALDGCKVWQAADSHGPGGPLSFNCPCCRPWRNNKHL